MTTDNVRSIQGEQQGVDEEQVYHSIGGPGTPLALSKLAPKGHVQRLVIDVETVSDKQEKRADGEWRRTIKQQVVDVVEYGESSVPETDNPSLFDQVDDDVSEG